MPATREATRDHPAAPAPSNRSFGSGRNAEELHHVATHDETKLILGQAVQLLGPRQGVGQPFDVREIRAKNDMVRPEEVDKLARVLLVEWMHPEMPRSEEHTSELQSL